VPGQSPSEARGRGWPPPAFVVNSFFLVSVIFALPAQRALVPGLTGETTPALGAAALARFPNGELYARIETPVANRVCGVLGSLAPPDEQLLSTLLLAHTLEREAARRIVALLPYLGYARQDRADPGQSLGIAWAGDLLRAVGVERIVTVDLHSSRAATSLGLPVDSLSPARLFAGALERDGLGELSVVAPDEGARERCDAVARAAGIAAPRAYLRKRRDAGGVAHGALVGEVGPRVALVDDILDTGATLVSACAELRRNGVREIIVCATHGLFTGERWRELPALGVRRIHTTDSVPSAGEHAGELVEVHAVGGLVVDAFAMVADERAGQPEP
jgi:ribose-phosphate pyrophosphokinase